MQFTKIKKNIGELHIIFIECTEFLTILKNEIIYMLLFHWIISEFLKNSGIKQNIKVLFQIFVMPANWKIFESYWKNDN